MKFSNRSYSSITSYINKMMNVKSEIVFDKSHPSKIAFIGLNRPKAKNSLGIQLVSELSEAIKHLKNDQESRVVIIGSLVPNLFCAGADLKERGEMKEDDIGGYVRSARMLFQEIAELPIVTICAIDGPALGGGLEFALACDLRYGTTNSLLGLVETRLGIIPGAGGTQRLPRIIGINRAKELMFLGKRIDGTQAFKLGILNEVVQQNNDGFGGLYKAFEVANEIAVSTGPVALRMAKEAIVEGMKCGPEVTSRALEVEDRCYAQVITTKDRMEGIAAFKEKRKPKFEGK